MSKKEYLESALSKMSLWPRFHPERAWNYEFAVSMLCFCDIPLSQIKNHISSYGAYGLGLSKEWGMRNEAINPVLYVSDSHFRHLVIFTKDGKIGNSNKTLQIMSRIKRLVGPNYKDDENGNRIEIPEYIYYDEREWRYVPDALTPKEYCFRLTQRRKLTEDIQTLTDKNGIRLVFSAKDIRYIFIDKEGERIEFIRLIDSIRPALMTDEEKIVLKSRIITKDQIFNDF